MVEKYQKVVFQQEHKELQQKINKGGFIINYVFNHPSKYANNKEFQHYEKIGDSFISNIVVNLIYEEFGSGDDLHDDIKQVCVSNDSLAVSALLKDFQKKIDCKGPLTLKMLSDTYEAFIGERNQKVYRKINSNIYLELVRDIYEFVYDYDNTPKLSEVYNTYKNRAKKFANENGLGNLNPKLIFVSDSGIYLVELTVNGFVYSGKNRNHKKSNLICYLKFLEDYNVSLK